jgi:hypothetical protein
MLLPEGIFAPLLESSDKIFFVLFRHARCFLDYANVTIIWFSPKKENFQKIRVLSVVFSCACLSVCHRSTCSPICLPVNQRFDLPSVPEGPQNGPSDSEQVENAKG